MSHELLCLLLNFYEILNFFDLAELWRSGCALPVSTHTDAAMKNNQHGKSKLHTNLIKIASPFTAIALKRGSLLFSEQEVRAGRKWLFQLHFPLCHTFVMHLMSEERQLNIAFTDVGIPSYLALIRPGQLLCHPQENNNQGVPLLWTPPNKPARQTSLKTRQPYIHDLLRWTDHKLNYQHSWSQRLVAL